MPTISRSFRLAPTPDSNDGIHGLRSHLDLTDQDDVDEIEGRESTGEVCIENENSSAAGKVDRHGEQCAATNVAAEGENIRACLEDGVLQTQIDHKSNNRTSAIATPFEPTGQDAAAEMHASGKGVEG